MLTVETIATLTVLAAELVLFKTSRAQLAVNTMYVKNATASAQHRGNVSSSRLIMTQVQISSDVLRVEFTHQNGAMVCVCFCLHGSFLY